MLNLKRILTSSMVTLGLLTAGLINASAAEKTKSYDLSFQSATKVGTQVLTPGDYKLHLDGANAVFTRRSNGQNKASVTAPAKLEAGSAKFDHTTMHVVLDAGQPRISSIELKGSKDLVRLD